MCYSVGKADLMSDHFHSKQSREAVDLPLTCHPSHSLTTFAFRSSEERRLLLDLDPYGGTDPLGTLFLTRTVDVMATRLSVVFRRLVRLGCFPACWRQANVIQFRKVHRPLLLPIIIIIIIIIRDWQCKAGRERLTPYQSEYPNPTTPTLERKKRKGKQ